MSRHAERGAVATLALYPVEDPSSYGLVRRNDDGAVTEFLEKPDPAEIDTDEVNAGAYVLERSVADLIPPGRDVSIEREIFPRLVGQGLYGLRLDGYWMDIGTPERYLQASWDILERRGRDRGRRAHGRRRHAASTRSRGRRRSRARGARPGRGRAPRGPALDRPATRSSARTATIGEGAGITGSVLHPGCASAPARGSRDSILGPASRSATRPRSSRGLDRGRGSPDRAGRAAWHERASSPARLPREHDAGRDPRGRLAGPARRRPGLPEHLSDALCRVESARIASLRRPASSSAGWAARRSAATWPAPRSATGSTLRCTDGSRLQPAPWTPPDRVVLCSSYSGNTEETLACFEAAAAVGAQRIVATTGGALGDAARRGERPGDPVPGRRSSRGRRSATCSSPRPRWRRWPAPHPPIRTEIDVAVAHLRASRDALVERARVELADGLDGTFPVIYGSDLTASGRVPLEDADQREREASRPSPLAARDGPQRDRRLGGWRRLASGSRPSSSTDRDQHPRERAALRADRGADRSRQPRASS